MEDGAAERTKDVEQLYVENNILANELFNMKQKIEGMIPQMNQYTFVGRDNLKHTHYHFDAALINQMKQSIGKYQAIKANLDQNRFKFYDLNQIKANITAGADSVSAYIKNSAAIPDA